MPTIGWTTASTDFEPNRTHMTTQVAERYRLVTRSDFDGLVCAALLKELGILDDIKFVHPKDMQDGLVELTERDITTNLPYVPGVHLSFDHHDSETIRVADSPENHVIVPGAKSAARVVYDYYGGARTVDVHIRRLRAKLGAEHAGRIKTVRGVGYRFEL